MEQINQISDKSGRILLVEATIDDTVSVHEIRKFLIDFSKLQAQNTKKRKLFLENKLKILENNTSCIEHSEYIDCRNKLDKIHEQKNNGMRIRSKCDWYEYREISLNFLLILKNLELHKAQLEILQKIKKPYMS